MNIKYGIVYSGKTPVKNWLAREMRRKMTPAEAILWNSLRRNQLDGYHFRRQQVVDGFIADFFCYKVNLIVEVDGVVHEDQIEYDEARDLIISSGELRILRISNDLIRRQLTEALNLIRAELHISDRKPDLSS